MSQKEWGFPKAEKMQTSLLSEDDKLFLSNLQSCMRSSMEFSILGIQPKDSDLVQIDGKQSPYLALMLGQKSAFVSLGELRQLSEDSAQKGMIYDAWMNSALQNAYIFSKPLQTEDAFRFITYFKTYHEIDNEEALAAEAREALDRARQELYRY